MGNRKGASEATRCGYAQDRGGGEENKTLCVSDRMGYLRKDGHPERDHDNSDHHQANPYAGLARIFLKPVKFHLRPLKLKAMAPSIPGLAYSRRWIIWALRTSIVKTPAGSRRSARHGAFPYRESARVEN
jgi:hypothetical protein